MFIGHNAAGLALKKFAPKTSLDSLIAAPTLLDLLWPDSFCWTGKRCGSIRAWLAL